MPIWVWLLIALGTGTLVGLISWATMTGSAGTIADMLAHAIGILLAVVFVGSPFVYGAIALAHATGILPNSHHGSATRGTNCDPNYTGACLKPNVGDYDCIGGSGDGPNYTGTVTVVGTDVYGLDRDGNGIGCQ